MEPQKKDIFMEDVVFKEKCYKHNILIIFLQQILGNNLLLILI